MAANVLKLKLKNITDFNIDPDFSTEPYVDIALNVESSNIKSKTFKFSVTDKCVGCKVSYQFKFF